MRGSNWMLWGSNHKHIGSKHYRYDNIPICCSYMGLDIILHYSAMDHITEHLITLGDRIDYKIATADITQQGNNVLWLLLKAAQHSVIRIFDQYD